MKIPLAFSSDKLPGVKKESCGRQTRTKWDDVDRCDCSGVYETEEEKTSLVRHAMPESTEKNKYIQEKKKTGDTGEADKVQRAFKS